MGCLRSRTPGSWQLLFYVDGVQKSKTVKASKRDAEKLLREIERSIDLGTYDDGSRKVVMVGDVLKEWLREAKQRVVVTTYGRYEIAVRRWLLREFGGFALNALTPQEINAIYRKWQSEGASPGSIKTNHDILRAALQHAVNTRLTAWNAASVAKPPSLEEARSRVLNDDQIRLLLDSAPRYRYGAQASLALLTGMRLGEVCALRWENVDLEGGRLEVRRSSSRLPGGDVIVKKPKTKSSIRQVGLCPRAIALLSSLPRNGEYVFGGDKPITPTNVSEGVKRMCIDLGLPVTMHGLRHSHASFLNRMGVNPKAVQERLGHSSLSETMDTYTHLLPHQQGEAVDALRSLMS